MENYVFFLHATLDFRMLDGLTYSILIYCEDSGKKAAVDESIMDRMAKIEWSYTFSEKHSMFVVHCENTTEAEGILNFVRGLDGVEELRMDITEGQITVQDWIDDEIESMVSRPETFRLQILWV